ncbi:hypothetical protein DER46DRAFT_601576 [Fusarium sp. MPI-SDFR-AT-0072]|nr:hypothetical protein DER46DRAFT_601576 [Fusarium sp. MPI-SDFR-AT-0072]
MEEYHYPREQVTESQANRPNSKINMVETTKKSLHVLSVENPDFCAYPLFWTGHHLQMVDYHTTWQLVAKEKNNITILGERITHSLCVLDPSPRGSNCVSGTDEPQLAYLRIPEGRTRCCRPSQP